LDKASLDFTKLKDSSEALQKEKLLEASQLQGEIDALKLHRNNEQEVITKLSNELEIKTYSFEEKLKVQHDQLSNRMQVMRTEFETESQRAAVEIERLTVALQQKDERFKTQQEKLRSLLTDHDKLKDTLAHLEAKNEKMANEFSASKFQLSQELKTQKDNLMVGIKNWGNYFLFICVVSFFPLQKKVSGLELEIKNKEAKMLELERDKNVSPR